MPKKIMPHSEEAEQAVLGSILALGRSGYEKVVGWIRDPNAFYEKNNQILWSIFKELYEEQKEIDTLTVFEVLKDKNRDEQVGAYYLTGLIESVPSTANMESYARIVWERYVQRMTALTAQKLYQISYEKYEDVAKLIDQHRQWIEELQSLQPTQAQSIDHIIDRSVESQKDKKGIIRFNIPALDFSAGGMTRKEITVIGGRPGHGKSLLMLNIVSSLLKQGLKVMLINREMTNEETIKRMIVMESVDLPYTRVRRMDLAGKEMKTLEKVAGEMKDMYKNLIMIDSARTLDQILIEANRHKPDVILDDYIQLIDMGTQKDRRFQIEDILREYKWLAKKNNCTCILVSQLNREIERRQSVRPRLSDYAESGAIEQIAETAMFVFHHFNLDPEKDKYESEIIVAKARYGRIGTHIVGFNGNRCKFYADRTSAYEDDIK